MTVGSLFPKKNEQTLQSIVKNYDQINTLDDLNNYL